MLPARRGESSPQLAQIIVAQPGADTEPQTGRRTLAGFNCVYVGPISSSFLDGR